MGGPSCEFTAGYHHHESLLTTGFIIRLPLLIMIIHNLLWLLINNINLQITNV